MQADDDDDQDDYAVARRQRVHLEMARDVIQAVRARRALPAGFDLGAFRLAWGGLFLELNAVDPRHDISGTDMGFLALCHAYVAQKPPGSPTPPLVWLPECFQALAVIASQHTPDSRTSWPEDGAWIALGDRIAQVAVAYLATRRTRARLAHALESGATAFEAGTAPAGLRAEFEALRTPPALVADRQRRKREAEERKETLAEVGPEGVGAMWRLDPPEELVGNFLRLAARTVHAIETNTGARDLFPVAGEVPRFTAAARARALAWARSKAAIEQTDEFLMQFRQMAMRWLWPLGAETHYRRDPRTRNDAPEPLTTLGEELGVELTQLLHDSTLRRMTVLAEDTVSVTWEALFASFVDNTLRQRLRVQWLRDYVAQPDEADRLLAETRMGDDPRPLLARVCKRWQVLHRHEWYPCEDLVHAVLLWVYLVRTAFDGELEAGVDLAASLDELLPRTGVHTL